jgi:uncharacterized protein
MYEKSKEISGSFYQKRLYLYVSKCKWFTLEYKVPCNSKAWANIFYGNFDANAMIFAVHYASKYQ